jgi:hypothetical protein
VSDSFDLQRFVEAQASKSWSACATIRCLARLWCRRRRCQAGLPRRFALSGLNLPDAAFSAPNVANPQLEERFNFKARFRRTAD